MYNVCNFFSAAVRGLKRGTLSMAPVGMSNKKSQETSRLLPAESLKSHISTTGKVGGMCKAIPPSQKEWL